MEDAIQLTRNQTPPLHGILSIDGRTIGADKPDSRDRITILYREVPGRGSRIEVYLPITLTRNK